MIKRRIAKDMEKLIGSNKAIIITGARKVGKSTILNDLFQQNNDALWLRANEPEYVKLLSKDDATPLRDIIGDKKVVIIDEAQRIDIAQKLKQIRDCLPNVQIIATASSSFGYDINDTESIKEKKLEYQLFPLSYGEMVAHTSLLEEQYMLSHRLIYGYYPEVVASAEHEKETLKELSSSYLFNDIFATESIKKPQKFIRVLQSLAYQVGSPISSSQIGRNVDLDTKTVEKYIDILERRFIIYRLSSYAHNYCNELKLSKKIYFYDNGIRNAVLANFTQLESRSKAEVEALWENFILSERIKRDALNGSQRRKWFWRTTAQKEIDYLEEKNNVISAYEFKWDSTANYQCPKAFDEAYPHIDVQVISRKNINEFLLD